MNHREFVQSFYPTQSPAMVTERELDYSRTFPADATPPQIAEQILRDLDGESGLLPVWSCGGGWRD